MSLIDELLDESKPAAESEEWEYKASTGRTFKFRTLPSAADYERISDRKGKLEKRTTKNTPAIWHPFLPISPNIAMKVALLETTLVEPKLSTVDLLKLANLRGGYFLELAAEATTKISVKQTETDDEEMDELGEDSGQTASDAPSSPLPETATDGTSTS
jgi:hypothetical protein